ncbi:phage/plasmid primase, P4 family [Oscillospiraceae bacterium PP1C4]
MNTISQDTQVYYNFNNLDYIDKRFLFPKTDDKEQKIEQLAITGFIAEYQIDGSVRFKFNQNIFAKYLSKAIVGVQDDAGNLYIYNIKGFYVQADAWVVGKLVKYLMCQIIDLWSKPYEQMGIDSYNRDIKKIVKDFNKTDHINLANGILDIRDMTLASHSPSFYSTIQLPINYCPNAGCRRFVQYIKEITGNDQELACVLQEVVGYCLCHNVKAEKAFFLFGMGKNGKSVFIKVIEQLVGNENISNVELEKLGSSFGIASMVNKNVNISAENELKTKLNTQYFKAIVSGDTLNISRKYKDDIQCSLSCKLIMLANSLPDTADFTYGYFRKILIIPFNQKFDEENQDVYLFEKLSKELPGILNWALEGLNRLQANSYRFSTSTAINNLMKSYNNEQNPTGDFFKEFYEEYENGKIKKSELYSDYQYWMNENGLEAPNKQLFWKMLKNKAAESGSDIILEYKRVRGTDYLQGYKRKYPVDQTQKLDINF